MPRHTRPASLASAAALRSARAKLGISQVEAAHRSGVSLSVLGLAERGLVTDQTLAKLARFYRVPTSALLGHERVAG